MRSGFSDYDYIAGQEDEGKVKVAPGDIAGYLSTKLAEGANITLTVNEDNIVIAADIATAITNALDDYTSGHVIKSDGENRTQRTNLNFIGSHVKVVDDEENDTTKVEVSVSDGHVIFVNTNNARPQRTGLKFVGGRVTTTDDPTGDKTVITIEGGYTIKSEGVAVTARANLDFVGDAVDVTDDNGTDTTTISVTRHVIKEEGGELARRSAINFVGTGVTVVDNAEDDETVVAITTGSGSAIEVQEKGVALASRSAINFVGRGVAAADDPSNERINVVVAGGIGSDYTLTPVKTSSYTAVAGDAIPVNTTAGGFIITLPSSGAVKILDAVGVQENEGLGVNAVTVNPGTNTILGESELVLDVGGTIIELELVGTDWRIIDLNAPLYKGMDGSLGAPGVDGNDGADGADGADGLSAYEVAVANGFVGDESAWLASLVGVDGVDGTGFVPRGVWNNVDTYNVNDSVTHEGSLWAANTGNTNKEPGVEPEWTQWVSKGDTGNDGADGTNGVDGVDGASAYEVAVANGFVGDEVAWLASLVGADGNDGADGATGSISAASGLTLDLVSEPATPDPNKLIIWASVLDGLLYKKDENGIVEAIGVGAGNAGGASLSDIWLFGGF